MKTLTILCTAILLLGSISACHKCTDCTLTTVGGSRISIECCSNDCRDYYESQAYRCDD